MNNATLLRRVMAILRYAYPNATYIEATLEPGWLSCTVDGVKVPAPPKEAYA